MHLTLQNYKYYSIQKRKNTKNCLSHPSNAIFIPSPHTNKQRPRHCEAFFYI